jgi:hypothetical protein
LRRIESELDNGGREFKRMKKIAAISAIKRSPIPTITFMFLSYTT